MMLTKPNKHAENAKTQKKNEEKTRKTTSNDVQDGILMLKSGVSASNRSIIKNI